MTTLEEGCKYSEHRLGQTSNITKVKNSAQGLQKFKPTVVYGVSWVKTKKNYMELLI